jgi:hypothetical protein
VLVSYALAAVLLWAAVFMVKVALASRYSNLAEGDMLDWASGGGENLPSADDIASVKKRLHRSVSLDPESPTHHDRLSQLYLWARASPNGDPDPQRRIHDEGMAEVRRGIALCPGWALSWARLLVWKAEYNERDEEFRTALERVTTLGQWQFTVHPIILRATLPLWDALTSEDRDRVMQAAVRGLRQIPAETLPILMEFEKLADICRIITDDEPLHTRYCAGHI